MTPAASAKATQSPLRQELKRHWPQFRKAQYFSLVASLLMLTPTLFMLQVYDRVVNSRSTITLVMLLVLVIGAYVVMELLDTVRNQIMYQTSRQFDEGLRTRTFDAAFAATLQRGGGSAPQALGDLRTVRDFMASPAMMALMDAPSALFFLVLIFFINPKLGFIAALGAVVQVILAVRTERKTMPLLTEANRASGEAQAYANGALRNAQVIEAMGMVEGIRSRWMGKQRTFLQRQAEASEINGTNTAIGKFIQTAQGSLILGVSCLLTLEFGGGAALSGGMMIFASMLGGRMLAPLIQLVAQWRAVVNARDAWSRADALLQASAQAEETMPLPPPVGKLTVENVVAAPPGTQLAILKGVSLAVEPGQLLVVAGPSASGKTTLARLLTGVWPAVSGKVRLDGVDVYAWNKEELGPHVGYLPQGVELFDGTLAENVARFGDVDPDKVRAAVTLAGLDELVASLPEGVDTRIGDEGAFLSGGQRQRVGLARAVYGMPKFVVLDEPNSSLDEAGEKALSDLLAQLKAARCTVVVMSHRPTAMQLADLMLVLRDGQVALFGPRDEVLAALRKGAEQAAAQRGGRPMPAPGGAPRPPGIPAPRPPGAPGPRAGGPGAGAIGGSTAGPVGGPASPMRPAGGAA
ncbi:MAG: hypothetical protein RIS35_1582 [Pseudomonadota bacterium]|jgi:ATP-binding cassette subfamily C exporter for protease/lipase